ncbi:unnamed protein product [Phaedon cochleariae]|uniref:EFHB C-terminal EF-hand domain-containing protein n=1 Tax=Phaedon cochleariae TaxID=80249 RepID=A0A9P0DI52_PHACE|nr:unnamed protein product [Phaedon cochleariae]
MAGNQGKFIDRSPIICAAGKSNRCNETVDSTLHQYSLEDKISAIKHDAKIWHEDVFKPPLELPPIQNACFRGTNTEIKPLLNPTVNTRFQSLIEDLKNTTYDSYWNKPIGKGRDQVPGLPKGMDPIEVTFGKQSEKGIPMKELVNPPKSPYEVLYDSQIGHEMYQRTHNDYNPSEQIKRGYLSPPFNSEGTFGIKTKYDYRGIGARCACNWHITEPVVHANKIQADYLGRVQHGIGKPLAPNRNIDCVPEGHTFGDRSDRAFYGVEDLLKDSSCEPCIFKRDFHKWLASLNQLRIRMAVKKRHGFNFRDFYRKCLYWDKEKSGYLAKNIFYELCSCHHLDFAKEDIESLLNFLQIIVDENIHYEKFIELINVNGKQLYLMPVKDIPKNNLYYVTTSQAASCDYLIIDNSAMLPAGIPSIRNDLSHPIVPPSGCKADLENLGDNTSVKTLISPSIYNTYGLTFSDFYEPRQPGTIKKLFENIGYTFPGSTFEKFWQEGLELDQTGLVCVETFKNVLNKYSAPMRIRVDERDCKRP